MKEKQAEMIYNQILTKQIYPLTGVNSTFMNDLDKVGRKLFGVKFKGVFPSDKIPKLNDGNGLLVDTDNDAEQKISQTDCGARSLAFLVVFDKYGSDIAKLI